MLGKDGITYKTEQEYPFAEQNNGHEPKKHTAAASVFKASGSVRKQAFPETGFQRDEIPLARFGAALHDQSAGGTSE